VCEAEIQLYKS